MACAKPRARRRGTGVPAGGRAQRRLQLLPHVITTCGADPRLLQRCAALARRRRRGAQRKARRRGQGAAAAATRCSEASRLERVQRSCTSVSCATTRPCMASGLSVPACVRCCELTAERQGGVANRRARRGKGIMFSRTSDAHACHQRWRHGEAGRSDDEQDGAHVRATRCRPAAQLLVGSAHACFGASRLARQRGRAQRVAVCTAQWRMLCAGTRALVALPSRPRRPGLGPPSERHRACDGTAVRRCELARCPGDVPHAAAPLTIRVQGTMSMAGAASEATRRRGGVAPMGVALVRSMCESNARAALPCGA